MLNRLFGARANIPEVTVEEALRRQSRGALLVDVRQTEEWAQGHVPGARHIPLGELDRRVRELPQDAEVLLLCARGNRGARATALLQRTGFPPAASVAGGIVAWAERGLPLTRG